jgi:hypothetical protein
MVKGVSDHFPVLASVTPIQKVRTLCVSNCQFSRGIRGLRAMLRDA